MKRTMQLSLLLVLFLTGCNQAAEQKADSFTFAFLTDIHLQPELNAVEGFNKAIDTINQINPDFVITGGDLVMDALNQTYGRADSLYNLYKEVAEGFNMPVYNMVGNHEVFGWHSNSAEVREHPEFGKKMFEKKIGKRFYSFDHKGWHFIVLDAISLGETGRYTGNIDEEQIVWLKQDLEKIDKETPIVVSVHIPFITTQTQLTKGSLVANPEGLVINNARDVLLIFWEYNLKLVLQGHLHSLEDLYVGNRVRFITGGAICGRWWANKPGTIPEEGFMLIHVNGEEIASEYVDYGWTPKAEN